MLREVPRDNVLQTHPIPLAQVRPKTILSASFTLCAIFRSFALGIVPVPILRGIFLGIGEWLSGRFSDSELGPQSAQGDACSDSEKCFSVCGDGESGTSTIAGADAWSTVVTTGWGGALTRNRLWCEALRDGVLQV